MNDEITQQMKETLENIDQMLKSAAVHGEQFRLVATAQFEICQIMELLAHMAALAKDEHNELVEIMATGATNLLVRILTKVGHGMESKKFLEAAQFGEVVHQRKTSAQDRINKMI